MSEPTHAAGDDEAGGLSRRRLIQLLVGLGIGIPVSIELATLVGLLSGSGESTTVGIGDELLPETPQAESVADSGVYGGSRYELVVQVENAADAAYELRLGPLFLDGGTRVAETATTGPVQPGATTTLTAEWSLPADGTPTAVRARATWGDQSVDRRVDLEKPPVYGG